jgi:hypothetical protein
VVSAYNRGPMTDTELKDILLTLCNGQAASIQLIQDLQSSLSVLQTSIAPIGSDPAFRLDDTYKQMKKGSLYDQSRTDELKKANVDKLLALADIIRKLEE